MTFHLTDQDWLAAEAALKGKPSGTKYEKYPREAVSGKKDKKVKIVSHSFLIIDNVIYALANSAEDPPEEGGASVVKQGMTKDGKLVAIKINSADMEDMQSDSMQASIKNNLFIGQGVRVAPQMHIKLRLANKTIKTQQKRYTVMEWRGKSLISQIESKDYLITNTQKWLIGLRACLLVEKLHKDRIIHGDLKAENLTARIQGNDIELKVVDFEYAKVLAEGESFYISSKAKGSVGFFSPEILSECRFSYLSETYALAIMLLFQIDVACKEINFEFFNNYNDDAFDNLRLGRVIDPMDWLTPLMNDNPMDEALEQIFIKMLAKDVSQRIGSEQMIGYLCDQLLSDKSLDQGLVAEILEIKAQYVVSGLNSAMRQEPLMVVGAASSSSNNHPSITVAYSTQNNDEQRSVKKAKIIHSEGHEPKINP